MTAAVEAYPLYWPTGRGRRSELKRLDGKFVVGFARARDEMLAELERLGAREIVVSTNIPLRRDGLPYAGVAAPKDPAVAVYFTRHGKPYVFACDTYRKVEHNIRAIGMTVEAFRSIARHGATEMLEQAFTGFQALPAPRPLNRPWWEVLGFTAPGVDVDAVKQQYRRLAQEHHPDRGGDHARMADINAAYDLGMRWFSRGESP